ncbi:MAG: di-heme oxidoredictase family protein [Thermoanaerobaculia bacterium]
MTRARRWARRVVSPEGLVLGILVCVAPMVYAVAAVEAPAGYDGLTNGFEPQTQFDLDRATFDEHEDSGDGLGPVYNAQGCGECHQTPVSGAGSQVTELRVGRVDPSGNFVDHPGGSLINDRALDPALQEQANREDNVVAFRSSLSTLGDGYVEAIPDEAFTRMQAAQPPNMKGTILRVPLAEAPGQTRIARFGWKDQHASLLSFAADAYLNEMGITSPLQPSENSSSGKSVAAFDAVPDPEDAATPSAPRGTDVEAFVRFMRSTKVPARDAVLAGSPDAQAGAAIFHQIGCDLCHVPTVQTAPAGTVINGGTFTVPPALGDKIIHPYSDFMLHDVGTGDGIVQNGGQATARKLRTPPLWGLRARSRFMHDLASVGYEDAIQRHSREAGQVIQSYRRLQPPQRDQLVQFLKSL